MPFHLDKTPQLRAAHRGVSAARTGTALHKRRVEAWCHCSWTPSMPLSAAARPTTAQRRGAVAPRSHQKASGTLQPSCAGPPPRIRGVGASARLPRCLPRGFRAEPRKSLRFPRHARPGTSAHAWLPRGLPRWLPRGLRCGSGTLRPWPRHVISVGPARAAIRRGQSRRPRRCDRSL